HTLVLAGNQLTTPIWDIRTRRRLDPPLDTLRALEAVAFSPDGKTIASAGADFQDGTLRLWDLSTHKQQGRDMLGHAQRIDDLAFSPDASTLASVSDDGTMRLWDVRTHHSLGTPLPVVQAGKAYVSDVAFSPDGRTLATAASDAVRLWQGILWKDF